MKRSVSVFLCFCLLSVLSCGALSGSFLAAAESPTSDSLSPLPVSYGKTYTLDPFGCVPSTGYEDDGTKLTDHIFASKKLSDSETDGWIGYTSDGGDFLIEIILDLGNFYQNLRHFTVSCLQNTSAGVYFPSLVRYAISEDGRQFTYIGDGICDCDLTADPYCGLFNLTTDAATEARYVRVTLEGKTGQSIFLCEAVVEGRANTTRIQKKAIEGEQYIDTQGVIYTLRDGYAVVSGYLDTTPAAESGSLTPSSADFSREGDYLLGAGSSNEVTVHAEFVDAENANFSNLTNDIRLIVIHNTATVEPSTTASLYHRKLLNGTSDSSWHYTVDNGTVIYHTIPDEYAAWHAGSSENYASIGIELCVNGAPVRSSGAFVFSGEAFQRWVNDIFLKTIENTAVLVAELLIRYDLPEEAVVQHYDCSGKNCPQWMRYQASSDSFVHDGDLWLVLKERIHAYYTQMSGQSGFTRPASNVVLPEYLLFFDGLSYPVTEIGDAAFAGKSPVLESITLPDTIDKIAENAFADSFGLISVKISSENTAFRLQGTDLYDLQGNLLFTPAVSTAALPDLDGMPDLWIETAEDGTSWLLGLSEGCTVEEIRALSGCDNIQLYAETAATGAFLIWDGAPLRIVLQGDANGDGKVSATDYMIAKRTVLGTYSPTPITARALMLTDGKTVSAVDYMKLKRYILGTYDLQKPVKPF